METGEQKSDRLLSLEKERERAYEYGLPEYLQHDLDAYKEGLKTGSTLMDCLWGDLYGGCDYAGARGIFTAKISLEVTAGYDRFYRL